jgi:rubrerythrin
MKRDKMTAAIILKTIWEAIPSLFLIVIIIGGILSGYKYRCGNCGQKLREKGQCPHCGAVNE